MSSSPATQSGSTRPATRKLRIGQIGVANFGAYRRERLRETGCFQMVACHDRNPDAMRQACQQDNAQPAQSLEQLLANPQIEGLVISTGVDTHAPFAIAAMQAGKHVFIEKPLCGTKQEIEQLRQAQKKTARVVGVGHSDNHVDVIARRVMQSIESGELGAVVCYECNSSHSGGLEIKPGDWRGIKDKNPGGMLIQCGVHSLHRLNHLFGRVHSLSCMMRFDAHPDTETADVANVLLRHESGLIGVLNCYHVTAYCHELRVFGTKGNLYIDTQHHQAWYQKRLRGEVETRVPIAMDKPGEAERCANVLNWYRAILGQGEARPSLEDGIAAVAPVFAAQESHDQGRLIAL